MFAIRTLFRRRLRLALTVCGIALCVVLTLFLQAVYRGVRLGSVEYVAQSGADVWVLQPGQTNVLRGSSVLPATTGDAVRVLPGVESVSPVLFLMAGVVVAGGASTVYVTGFDPASGVGGPPALAAGRRPRAESEIVLDESFARKHAFAVGDVARIGDEALAVVGLSTGTNMFVIQYAFTTLDTARSLAGRPDVVSTWLVEVAADVDPAAVATAIRTQTGCAAYDHRTFLANNVREMESGFLPLLYAIAVIGAVVLTAILSLLLSIDVVERRGEFAVMKAIGAPAGYVPTFVVRQALCLAGLGLLAALAFYFPLVWLIEQASPEVSARIAFDQILATGVGVAAIGLLSSLLPIRRLRRVYALEVFR